MVKTALELTPEEIRRYNPAKRMESHPIDRWQKAWELVPKLATILRDQVAADRVVVFGSLTDESRYTPWSDIDLAVWGIAPDQFYRAIGVVNEISSEFKVDLVDLTARTCRPSAKQAIYRTGVVV